MTIEEIARTLKAGAVEFKQNAKYSRNAAYSRREKIRAEGEAAAFQEASQWLRELSAILERQITEDKAKTEMMAALERFVEETLETARKR